MSDVFDYGLLDTIMIPDEETFDFSFLDSLDPIGQNQVNSYDVNAASSYDPVPDLDFNPAFLHNPSLPELPDATTNTGQSVLSRGGSTAHSPAPPTNRDMSYSSEGSASALSAQSPSHAEPVEPKHNSWICQVCNESFTEDNDLDEHSRSLAHATWICRVCNKSYTGKHSLRIHALVWKHPTWACQVCDELFTHWNKLEDHYVLQRCPTHICEHPGCSNRYISLRHLREHQQTPHLPSHREVWDDLALACAECGEEARDAAELRQHANVKKHSSHICLCGVKFARRDVLIRHLKGFDKKSATYPCTFCRSHRGKQAFRRRDHLVQHLRGYHKMEPEEIDDVSPPDVRVQSRQILICPYKDCEAYRDDAFKALSYEARFKARPFQKQADYNKHMRDVHEDSPFSCSVANCDRVRAKGYMREKDLMKHMADKHPEAPSYVLSEPPKHRCGICDQEFKSNSILIEHHRGSWRCQIRQNQWIRMHECT